MKIGIEVELHSDGYDCEMIAENEGLNFSTFKQIEGTSLLVKLSREYYTSTIEYNFAPFENNIKSFEEVRNYIQGQIDKYNLKLTSNGPAYVGTHIHIFDEDKINMRINYLLKGVLSFIQSNNELITKKGKNRIMFAHQLWGNYSWNNGHIWRNFLSNLGFKPEIYDNTKQKNKYNPIIVSKENLDTGKPKSLEIRIIPNEFIMNLKAFELMSLIASKKIYTNKIEVLDFLNSFSTYLNLTDINNNLININNDKFRATIQFYNDIGDISRIIDFHNINNSNYKIFISKLYSFGYRGKLLFEIEDYFRVISSEEALRSFENEVIFNTNHNLNYVYIDDNNENQIINIRTGMPISEVEASVETDTSMPF